MYASNFLYIFLAFREYVFDRKSMFMGHQVDEYVEDTLIRYYVIFANSSRLKDIYRVYFPDSYQKFLNYLYNGKICEFIATYNRQTQNKQLACDEFFYKSSGFGFFTIIATFTEEIRVLKDKADYYYKIADEKNFTYNETYFNCPKSYYDDLYKALSEVQGNCIIRICKL